MKLDLRSYKHHTSRLWRWMVSKDMTIFIMFVGLVTVVWWGRTMSSSRDGEIRVQLTYSGVDDRITFSTPLPLEIIVGIRDNGQQIRKVAKQDLILPLNLSTLLTEKQGKLMLTAEMLRPRLQDILPGSTIIQHIEPENIAIPYQLQERKIVPIRLKARIQFKPQYQMKMPAILSQDSICIYGTEQALQSIHCIYTDSILIDNFCDSITESVSLQLPAGIRTAYSKIYVTHVAEQYTDKSFTIPIQVRNAPKGKQLRLFPQMAEVKVQVGISHYSQVSQDDLVAVCDYPTMPSQALSVEIVSKNPYISNIRSNTSSVEYIIKR